ncbi:uncharacterized protein LOC141670420 [Apium graveolens]|uniref:uncharacterized protein LOC141670420 n=1 Tax=Apium graveolens TaxID=4045 RepID=UPI003D7908AE
MTSSMEKRGKSVVVNEEKEILCPMPQIVYNPYQIQEGQDEHSLSEHEDKDVNNHEKSEPKSSIKDITKGHYDLSAKDEEEIRERDEVFKKSPEYEKHKNSWIPLSQRVKGWTIVTCQRTKGGNMEKFYYQDNLTRQLRSKKQVYNFIRYGFVPKRNQGHSSSEAAENLVPEPKRQRILTPKEAVEEFLAEARSNLINYKG